MRKREKGRKGTRFKVETKEISFKVREKRTKERERERVKEQIRKLEI